MKKIQFINSNTLKILAMVLMLFDHLWATIVPDNQWMTCVGRLAFPIFAFMISEGYV
ncbi:MAG: conjugal transfer protein TraX, partial [Clostridia bacterium]|nr:conjugal transfer protein TraX [Clostridia bacterium]